MKRYSRKIKSRRLSKSRSKIRSRCGKGTRKMRKGRNCIGG